MAEEKRLITYQLTPLQIALLEWGRRHPHGRIQVILQDSIPAMAVVPTEDSAGMKTVPFDVVARGAGLLPPKDSSHG